MPAMRLQNLLWSARGKEWGFRFLHQPALHVGKWESVYQSIFGSDDYVPQRWHGTIILSEGTALPYVASRFNDQSTVWKDAAGREIPHEMLLILETASIDEMAGLDWERVMMDYVRSYYQNQFDKDSASIQMFVGDADSLDLPLQVAQRPSISRDIRIDSRHASIMPSDRESRLPLYEKLWRVLNMDLKVLMRRILANLCGGPPDNGE